MAKAISILPVKNRTEILFTGIFYGKFLPNYFIKPVEHRKFILALRSCGISGIWAVQFPVVCL